MSAPMSDHELERLSFYMQNDKQAILLCLDLIWLAHLWDDLVDGDVVRTTKDLFIALTKALGTVPLNLFYQKWHTHLAPMMMSASLKWINSCSLEKGNQDDKLVAFCIRNDLMGIIHYCMFLVGGPDWVMEIGPEFWQTFGVNTEKYEEFLAEYPETPHEEPLEDAGLPA